MSKNQRNEQPSTPPFSRTSGADGMAEHRPDQGLTDGMDASADDGSSAGLSPQEQAIVSSSGGQESTPEHGQDVLLASASEARRLVVVPGLKEEGGAVTSIDEEKQARRKAWYAARAAAARAAAARTAVARSPGTTQPVPIKERTSPLEAWPELPRYEHVITKLRRSRQRRFFGRLALFVGIPTLLMALYVFVWATPRYVSESEITYQTYMNTQSLSSGLVQSFFGGSSSGSVDLGSILYEYTRSATLLHKLDAKLNLKKYYSSASIDYPARMNANVSDEAFLRYYRNHVVDVSEGLGGYLTVDVQAFDPQFAQALAKAIVEACDDMVDQMTARARADGMKFAEEEVARQEDRVRKAQIAETQFQNEHRDLNPTNSATQFGQIVGSLETQLSQTRTALTNTLSYASPNAPQVQQLKNQITALEAQLRDQRNRLTGGDKTYSQILEEYARLQLEEQFAQNAYQSAQQGLAVARADAARKQGYLVDFVTPSHPDGPTLSFSIEYLASAFLGSLFLYAIGNLVVGAFRDQAGL